MSADGNYPNIDSGMGDHEPSASGSLTAEPYSEGDRCSDCLHWFWRDGAWHSLVPKTYADTPELARDVFCPTCFDRVQEEQP